MPDLDLVAQIAETIYQIQPQRIEPLPPLLDWRAIYRVHAPHGRGWLLRLLRLPHAARQLAWATGHAAMSVQPLAAALRESLAPIAGHDHNLRVTHGDCWYKNAIKTADRGVVLIDWDCAGVGLPILDVGYLLLTSH